MAGRVQEPNAHLGGCGTTGMSGEPDPQYVRDGERAPERRNPGRLPKQGRFRGLRSAHERADTITTVNQRHSGVSTIGSQACQFSVVLGVDGR